MFRSAERTCSNPDTANVDEPIFATVQWGEKTHHSARAFPTMPNTPPFPSAHTVRVSSQEPAHGGTHGTQMDEASTKTRV